MCGRYAATKDPATLMREFDAVDGTEGKASGADYNVAPTKNVTTVVERYPRDADGTVLEDEPAVRSLRVMRWGLVPFWAKDPSVGSRMINTRAETATEKPSFRKALSRRRCLVPADGWFEWKATPAVEGRKAAKEPYYMTTQDGSSLAFAGLWETWRDKAEPDAPPLITCSVLTTQAVGRLGDIHDRMPLVLPSARWQDWLDPGRTDAADLLTPPERDWLDELELRPVSTRVNNVRNNGPDLVDRVAPEAADLDAAQDALFDTPSR
ncbi:SOS response-associated peptidase [Saccharomonospora piscinae]|uniref:SOS response-associated peptidase n=1 Tax=Saccharomonospora piscinae TaxID=687388 RepID=UPI001106FC7A|nr:SOS response-associated peptidase [Saccharomonospora piscinae]TLW91919.1 SOS response-associated peptidase [Saccharomonospora piscinae]